MEKTYAVDVMILSEPNHTPARSPVSMFRDGRDRELRTPSQTTKISHSSTTIGLISGVPGLLTQGKESIDQHPPMPLCAVITTFHPDYDL